MNLYPGTCRECATRVAARAGIYRAGAVLCAACAARDTVAARKRVAVESREDALAPVIVRPIDFLGDAFGAYRGACDVAAFGYDSMLRAQTGRLEALPGLLAALRASGLEPVVAPAVAAGLQALADAARAEVAAADGRLATIERDLAARGLALFEFQRYGVRWLSERRAALLGDEMGCGKTVQALLALPERAAVVVVAPASVREKWVDECRRWRPDLAPRALYGRPALDVWPAPGRLVSLGYDGLPEPPEDEAAPALGAPARADVVLIYDEAHRLKGASTARARRGRALARGALAAGGRVWLLTGSPLVNRAEELWRVLEVGGLGAEAFGRRGRFLGLAASDPDAYAMLMRGVMLRREKAAVLRDLPPVLIDERRVAIDERARRLLDELEAELAAAAATAAADKVRAESRAAGADETEAERLATAEETRVRADVAAAIAMVVEGAVSIPFEMISRVKTCLAAAKIPAAREIVDEMEPSVDAPVVMFSCHLPVVRAFGELDGWARIDGKDAGPARHETVRRFQAGELAGLAVSVRAGGEGIDLTRAARCVLVDRDWTPAANAQAIARLDRIGQSGGAAGSVLAVVLVADHGLDARISELLAAKEREIARHITAAAAPATVATNDALRAETLAAAAAEAAALAGNTRPARAGAKPRRGPATELERWAAGALATLAGLDPDRAATRNDVGFNRLDGEFGHELAALAGNGGMTDGQWAAALRLLAKYRRQVGTPTDTGEMASGIPAIITTTTTTTGGQS